MTSNSGFMIRATFLSHPSGTKDYRVVSAYNPTTLNGVTMINFGKVRAPGQMNKFPLSSPTFVAIDRQHLAKIILKTKRDYKVADETKWLKEGEIDFLHLANRLGKCCPRELTDQLQYTKDFNMPGSHEITPVITAISQELPQGWGDW